MSNPSRRYAVSGWPSWLRWIVSGWLAVACLHAAAGPASAQEIQFWHYQTFGNQRALQKMVADFEKETGLKVRETSKPGSELYSAAIAAAAVGRGPDIMQVFTRNVPAMVTMLKAAPLSEGPWLKNYLPSFMAMGTYDGKVYGVPHSFGTPLVFYNKDIFKKAGLDPEKPPRTWADVIAYSKQIQEKTGKHGVTVVHDSLDFGATTMLMGNQARMLSDDGRRVTFDDERGIEIMQLWQDMVLKDKIHPAGEPNAMRVAFEAGEMAMRIDTSALLGRFLRATKDRFPLGVGAFPTWGDRPRQVPNSGSVLMVFAPEGPRRDNALKLLQFLSRPEISNEWARVSGYMPVALDPLADPKMAAFYKDNPEYLPILKQMQDTVPMVVWPADQAGEISVRLKNMIDALWLGKEPAPQIVHETAAGINKLLGGK